MARPLGGMVLFVGLLALVTPLAQSGEPPAKGAAGMLTVHTQSYPEPGSILVSIRVLPLSDTADAEPLSLDVQLCEAGQEKVLKRTTVATEAKMAEEIALDAAALPAREYTVTVELRRPTGQRLDGITAKVHWPGRSEAFQKIKVFNNFVWGLLELHGAPNRNLQGTHEVNVPYDRWLFVRSKNVAGKPGTIRVSLDSKPLHLHALGAAQTQESMRQVKAGKHVVQVAAEGEATLDLLEVRAVPEIQHSRYPTSTMYVKQGVQYDWDYLKRHILPHVNTIISSRFPEEAEPQLREWKQRGGKWISYMSRTGFSAAKDKGAETNIQACVEYYATKPGYSRSLLDGVLVDEFYQARDPYEIYTAATQRLNSRFPRRGFYPYAAGSFGKTPESVAFAKACIEGGGYVCWEAYLPEAESLKSALVAMRRYPHAHVIPFEERLPGLTRNLIWVPGVFSFPWPFADGYANVNYNAYLDMQFQFIATHPSLFGLGGVHIWRTGYCDEERLRWCGRFFRHYCLEGKTDRVSDDPYLLTHIQNPDFADGLKGWTLEAAAANAIATGQRDKFGKFIGRYYRGPDTFLVTRRQQERPNVSLQKIRDLKPGRLYSAKMLTGNYSDLLEGKSHKEIHPVAMAIEGAELLKDPTHSYQTPFPTRYKLSPFSEQRPFWLNYHWQVFRATAPTATLRISDWKSPQQPGGSAGQQFFYTFVEVKPYLEEESLK